MMNKLFFIFCISILFFSCTIEKRRYFKGYHVSHRQAQEPVEVQKREREKVKMEETFEVTQSQELIAPVYEQTNTISNVDEKPESVEIVFDGDKLDTDIVLNAPKEEGVLLTPKSDEVSRTTEQKGVGVGKRGGKSGDVGRIIFGTLTIVSFAIALLFLGSAFFSVDSLLLAVLLMISGFFVLLGLGFFLIYLLIKKKHSAKAKAPEPMKEPAPAKKKTKPIKGSLAPFLLLLAASAMIIIQVNASHAAFGGALGYFSLFTTLAPLCIVFGVITTIRIIRKIKASKAQG